MSQTLSTTAATTRTPLDVKLFYAFVGVIGAAMLGLLVFWRPPAPRAPGFEPDRARLLVPFSLTNQAGKSVSSSDVAGKFLVVNFIHTSCSISCLQVNQRMGELQNFIGAQPDVQLLSLTVDPRSDTPPVLAEFGQRFGADATRWQLLTGDKPQLYSLIETSFLSREINQATSTMPGGFHDVDRIAVVDRAGRVRRYFDGLSAKTPGAIAAFLEELRKETKAP